MVQNDLESKQKYWATCLSVRSFAHPLVHSHLSLVCLLHPADFARDLRCTHSCTRSIIVLTPLLVNIIRWLYFWFFTVLDHSAGLSDETHFSLILSKRLLTRRRVLTSKKKKEKKKVESPRGLKKLRSWCWRFSNAKLHYANQRLSWLILWQTRERERERERERKRARKRERERGGTKIGSLLARNKSKVTDSVDR